MPPLMRELLITPYMCMYQKYEDLVTIIQNRCLCITLDICSNMRYHNVNGKPQTPRWGGLHMEELEKLLSKLSEEDCRIIKQICAIVYRYLEKRGRL